MVRRGQVRLAMVLLLLGCVAAHAQSTTGKTITISGSEQSSGSVWDAGTATLTVNGYSKVMNSGASYGEYSTPSSIASWLAARVSMDTSAPVWAKASGATITLVPRVPDTPLTVSGSTTYDTGHFGSGSFAFGSASGTTVSPTLVLHCTPSSIGPSQVTNCTASITGDDAELGTYAPVNPIVFTINSSSWTTVAVSPDGDAVAEGGLSGASPGTYTIAASYSATSPYTDSYYPAMSVSTTVTVGSSDPTTTGVYQYKIKQSDGTTSGFDAAGNITAYYDSTSGQWNNIQYDALNRLVRADGPSAFNGSSPTSAGPMTHSATGPARTRSRRDRSPWFPLWARSPARPTPA